MLSSPVTPVTEALLHMLGLAEEEMRRPAEHSSKAATKTNPARYCRNAAQPSFINL
jgi:hypothetical protein